MRLPKLSVGEWILIGLGTAVTVVAGALWKKKSTADKIADSDTSAPAPEQKQDAPKQETPKPERCPQSSVADKILARCEPLIGAHIGSAKWNTFAPDYDVSLPGTSCGYLVAYALLGVLATRRGTNYLRTVAKQNGVWVPWTADLLPCPGDAYALGTDTDTGIVHVGIVQSASDTEWVTIDGGQGVKPDQSVQLVHRTYDRSTGMLSSPSGSPKPIAGWANVRGVSVS